MQLPQGQAQAFEGEIDIGPASNCGAPESVGLLHARFVRYPACQQLQLWLPQPGWQGYGDLRLCRGEAVLEQDRVDARLNGSVQMLWDTLPWPPGDYRIEIDHQQGWKHVLTLRKLPEGEPLPTVAPAPSEEPPGPVVYRDGFGKVIPDEDLLLREQVMQRLKAQFSRRLQYDGNYRAGTITYVEGDLRIGFFHEMGGGDCKFYIDVPTAERWEAATGTPLARREEILEFVAAQVQRDQAPSWRYEIGVDAIVFR